MRQEWCHGDNFNWRKFHACLVQENAIGFRTRTRKQWLTLFVGEVIHEVVQRFRRMSVGGGVPSLANTNDWLAFYLRNIFRLNRRTEKN